MAERRKDSKGRVLKENESERKQGGYQYRWRTTDGKRHTIYALTLDELRKKEVEIQRDKSDGIRTDAQNVTVNDIYDMWVLLKKGLKNNTFMNYQYMYNQFVRHGFGELKVTKLRKTDIRRFYNRLLDDQGLKVATIDNLHTVLHQVLDLAVEDEYLRNNPSDNALKELKQSRNLFTEKRKALTVAEQQLFLSFLRNSKMYYHWYPVFATMLGSGLRVGEVTGLRWKDVDLEERTISVIHTLVYYSREGTGQGLYFGINTPKTRAGQRIIPMIASVKEALLIERENQRLSGITSKAVVDGYEDFIFVNRFGNVQNQGTLNKAIRRITRDCNQEIIEKAYGKEAVVLLPRFSCHSLRHTFTTRLCEANVNVKVIQDALGHSDVSTTLQIYADVTKDLKKREFEVFEDFIKVESDET
ncbi:MAG TPA: site-specific integrase [Clostridiaceae bacterium]|nr:site-specific integrase [Clostridiaceae bacterium]